MTNGKRVSTLIATMAAMLLPATMFAQDSTQFQVERFEPLPAQGTNVLNVAKSKLVPSGMPTVGLFLHYADDSLNLVRGSDSEDTVTDRLIAHQMRAELWAGIGVFDILDIGFVLPIIVSQSGDDLSSVGFAGRSVEGTEIGDARIIPKLQLIDGDNDTGLGLAIIAPMSIPTGGDPFNSDAEFKFQPTGVLDWEHDSGLALSLNGGYLFRPQRVFAGYVSDDVIRWGAGAEVPTGWEPMKVIGTIFGDINLVKDQDAQRADTVEAVGALQFVFNDAIVTNIGGGAGINNGVGTPDFRVFASLGYTPLTADRDKDGIKDSKDQCPNDPEDEDGFEDTDGCPDLDNDEDQIPDEDDGCPDEPEDMDGFDDDDGCPDEDNDDDGVLDSVDECPLVAGVAEEKGCPKTDNDGDGILNDVDSCPEQAEDKDGYLDEDGCPETDNDSDGILDADDKCPNEPEDKDGFEDEDGCPDLDNDKDGVPDATDKCPNEPETINGVDDEDGCPDKGKSKVKITKEKIEILEKVFFDSGKATIKKRSYNLLSQVASVVKASPQITKIQIEGHTDDQGKDKYNLDLSQRRAEAVRVYISAQGVDTNRLVAKGFGEQKPIASNKSKSGRASNRRVEFLIVEVNGKATSSKKVVIEKKEIVPPEDAKKDAPKEEKKKDAPKEVKPK